MPRNNKRQRPDIDVFYAAPAPPANSQIPPDVVHRHIAFETNLSGITHNRILITVPGVASPPSAIPDSLIHDMDTANAMDTDNIPDLCDVEDDDEDDEGDEYPYNWMDPNFVQGQAAASTGNTGDTTGDKRPKRKPRLPTVCTLVLYIISQDFTNAV